MATMVIKHAVENFGAWKKVYDQADGLRQRHGLTDERVLRDATDSATLLVVHEFPSLDMAQAFASDPDLAATMQAAGLSGPPVIEFYNEAF